MTGETGLWILVIGIAVLLGLGLALAAYALALRLRNLRKTARRSHWRAVWEPLLLGVLAGDLEPKALHAEVGEREELLFVGFLLDYAKRVRGPERALVCRLAGPYLRRVAADLGDPDPERRARAVHTLALLGLPEYGDLLALALDDPSPLVAMTAARALANEERPQYLRAVLQRLHRFTTWSAGFLASMLASAGSSAAPILREALSSAQYDHRVRAVAADALAMLNDLAAADSAAEILAEPTDPELAIACLRLLAKVGRPEHVDSVRRQIDAPQDAVRAFAASALGRLGAPDDVARLRAALDDPSRWVAIHAARALHALGAHHVLAQLQTAEHPRAALAAEMQRAAAT